MGMKFTEFYKRSQVIGESFKQYQKMVEKISRITFRLRSENRDYVQGTVITAVEEVFFGNPLLRTMNVLALVEVLDERIDKYSCVKR